MGPVALRDAPSIIYGLCDGAILVSAAKRPRPEHVNIPLLPDAALKLAPQELTTSDHTAIFYVDEYVNNGGPAKGGGCMLLWGLDTVLCQGFVVDSY